MNRGGSEGGGGSAGTGAGAGGGDKGLCDNSGEFVGEAAA